ncbi:NAD(P)/FAD-dependent oxidoreductase [Blastococcus saxobsidens]|uniref:NAD/ferredoxin-dependent reductase-like protein n=1 Tax=Blastococcus saxobsidens TaxID=138336 RepID=A0A4Q7Y563_9ACTN|nr:FAD-dependent oxidoreductase [Blastococcus saxobsidens]RZU31055.1 NAD/ferredoxin-dependent reductase-like protein [Blastococcus saxobsidens]
MRTVAVVGASLAGLSAVRALRRQGFEGRVVVVGGEPHRPYDRPPLSKDFLAGRLEEPDLTLEAEGEDLGLEWRLGSPAVCLDPSARTVRLGDGSAVQADGVVLATGALPCRLPGSERYDNVHVLRTLRDALALREQLLPGRRLVVVGAGLIGLEVASTARALGIDVTVVDPQAAPMTEALGLDVAGVVTALHERNGVRLLGGARVEGLVGPGAGRAEGVQLHGGLRLPADLVLLAMGVRPAVEWLHGSGVRVDRRGVLCDGAGVSSIPGVVAVGDCSAWYDVEDADFRREEHWTAARERAAVAVGSLLGCSTPAPVRPPYFWSDQFGLRLQFTGRRRADDELVVEEGDPLDLDFLATYRREGLPVGVVALERGRSFTKWRRVLAAPAIQQAVRA